MFSSLQTFLKKSDQISAVVWKGTRPWRWHPTLLSHQVQLGSSLQAVPRIHRSPAQYLTIVLLSWPFWTVSDRMRRLVCVLGAGGEVTTSLYRRNRAPRVITSVFLSWHHWTSLRVRHTVNHLRGPHPLGVPTDDFRPGQRRRKAEVRTVREEGRGCAVYVHVWVWVASPTAGDGGCG